MDEARRHLQPLDNPAPGLAACLNWLSNHAFGDQHHRDESSWLNVGRLYRHLLGFSAALAARHSQQRAARSEMSLMRPEAAAQMAALMLCSEAAVRQLAARHPQLLQLDAGELLRRLVLLKQLLPSCDVALLVKQQPRLLLHCSLQALEQQVGGAVQQLQQGLPGADVAEMVQGDPDLLLADVQSGIAQLHELWQVDEAALRNSTPAHIALAVRALSDTGPPPRY